MSHDSSTTTQTVTTYFPNNTTRYEFPEVFDTIDVSKVTVTNIIQSTYRKCTPFILNLPETKNT